MRGKYSKSIITLTVISLFVACTINEPYLPKWDTQIKLHFRGDQFSMSEVLTDSTFTNRFDPNLGDTLVFISISDSTEPQVINESDLAFKADDDQIVEKIGIIHLDQPAPQSTPEVSLKQIFPSLPDPGTQIPPLPAQTVEPPANNVRFDSFQSIEIENGQMYLVFNNNLILEIDSGMVISVIDSASSLPVGQFLFSEKIPPGSSKESSKLDLADKTLANAFILNYIIPFTGIDTVHTITQSDLESSFVTDVVLSAIDVLSATAEVPEQIIEKEDSSPINTEDKSVTEAVIRKGSMELTIQNNLEINSKLEIQILTMVDDQNNPKIVNVDLFANQSTVKPVDLAGYTIKNHLTPGAAVDEIAYKIKATTLASDGFVTVSSDDDIIVNLTMDSIFVSYFAGSVDSLKIDIDPIEQSDLADLSDFEGSFKLPDVVFTLNFFNQINFDVDLDLTLTGINTDRNQQVVLKVARKLLAGTSNNPKKTVITLDKNNSTIVDLMAILPTTIKMEGNAIIDGSGSVETSDAIWSDYSIESPLKIKIDEDIFIKSTMDSIAADAITNEGRKNITEDLSDVMLKINTENGLPLGTEFKFFLAADSTDLFKDVIVDSTKKVVLTADLLPGITDENGLVNLAEKSSLILELNQEQLQIFNAKPIYYGVQVRIKSNDKAVTFRKNDLLKYNGLIDIKARVNVNDE